ncbi:MAG: hypothetical protein AB1801_11300, partial [Chloroflexota bacterium]
MMPIDFPTLNLVALAPEIVIVLTAIVAIAFDVSMDDKRIVGYVSLAGLAGAGVVSFVLLGMSAPAWQEMAISDGYSLILNLVFVITAALSILIALSYLNDRELQQGEYYTLLLFSTV